MSCLSCAGNTRSGNFQKSSTISKPVSKHIEAEPITSANWHSHPRILEVRAIYDEIQRSIRLGEMKKIERIIDEESSQDCLEKFIYDSFRMMYTDRRGVVRRYEYTGGSDDSMLSREFYYDSQGHLRFVYIKAGAVEDNTNIQHRIYFDETGTRIWESHKILNGSGYTFPEDKWPDDEIVFDPKSAFAKTNSCSYTDSD